MPRLLVHGAQSNPGTCCCRSAWLTSWLTPSCVPRPHPMLHQPHATCARMQAQLGNKYSLFLLTDREDKPTVVLLPEGVGGGTERISSFTEVCVRVCACLCVSVSVSVFLCAHLCVSPRHSRQQAQQTLVSSWLPPLTCSVGWPPRLL